MVIRAAVLAGNEIFREKVALGEQNYILRTKMVNVFLSLDMERQEKN